MTPDFEKQISNFLNRLWQEDKEIETVRMIDDYFTRHFTASDLSWKNYLRRLYQANEQTILLWTSDLFVDELQKLFQNE